MRDDYKDTDDGDDDIIMTMTMIMIRFFSKLPNYYYEEMSDKHLMYVFF